jgi:hypothetical protein
MLQVVSTPLPPAQNVPTPQPVHPVPTFPARHVVPGAHAQAPPHASLVYWSAPADVPKCPAEQVEGAVLPPPHHVPAVAHATGAAVPPPQTCPNGQGWPLTGPAYCAGQ